jgi:hypothetical protein
MDFGPGLDESLLSARQIAANTLDRIEREHALGTLVRRMKVRPVVRGADFHEHPNDDSEESRDLRHRVIRDLLVSRSRANACGSPAAAATDVSCQLVRRAAAVGCSRC